ncbi:response regulator [Geoalkalibacter halelectricus]|uniref:Response regulator n=1 Tax=Geoalkalibacter halelectricus TaxID=2847045 RepID=A0ABY5ZSB6_9BACT|nr:response regulator [Geoalkalibacter halelectricus]MDO3377413.1 response regulator [Geoalkalibacter halelectricus]UWZ80827.1 response regulator [Geoalkalibacter halelectricus]
MKNAVLVVDDEPSVIRAIARALQDEEVEVVGANSAEEAEALLEHQAFKVVISDQCMPGMEGSEFLARVSLRHPEIVRIMLTGHATLTGIMEAVNRGEIYRFFTKPWSDLELRFALRSAFEKYDLETRVRRLMAVARCQTLRLRQLEREHPGITRIQRHAGAHDLPLLDEEEIAVLLRDLGVEV